MKTADIQKLICKAEVLKFNHACENVAHLLAWECDVLSLNKSGYLSEFEVKITRSDFQAEKKKARKWELISERSEWTCPNYFWYVCPVGLIRRDEIPDYAGLIYTGEEKVQVVVSAPLLHKAKRDKSKVLEKFCRVSAERTYLGGCRLTYDNRQRKEKFDQVSNVNEWELAIQYKAALAQENYERCKVIKDEIDLRIENDTINHALMNGFRYYDPKKEAFTGPPNFAPFNGLFDNYKYPDE